MTDCTQPVCNGTILTPCVDGVQGDPIIDSPDCLDVEIACTLSSGMTCSGTTTSSISVLFEPVVATVCYANQCDYTTKTFYVCGGDNQWDDIIPNSSRCQDASMATTIGDVVEVAPVTITTTITSSTITQTSGTSPSVWMMLGGVGLIVAAGLMMYDQKIS